jgi:aspartate kinase
MLEMAASGAQVLALRSVEYARKYEIPIHVRSSFADVEGTWVSDGGHGMDIDQQLEQPIIRAVSYTTDEAKVTLRGVPDKPGVAARVFSALADAHVNVDTIIQNTSESGHSDISFTVPAEDLPAADRALNEIVKELGAREYDTDAEIAKISLIGAGMRSHPGVAATMFQTLADLGINLDMIGTSPIKISCVISKEHVDEAVRTLHTVFELDDKSVQHDVSDRGVS